MDNWCDICDRDDCYHLSPSEQAHKALDNSLTHDPLDNWICQHCPAKPSGDMVCKRDCGICGGVGLVRLKMRELKVYSKESRSVTQPNTSLERTLDVACPHCEKNVTIKLKLSKNHDEHANDSRDKFTCCLCQTLFSAYTAGPNA
jgi:hypothetical protein